MKFGHKCLGEATSLLKTQVAVSECHQSRPLESLTSNWTLETRTSHIPIKWLGTVEGGVWFSWQYSVLGSLQESKTDNSHYYNLKNTIIPSNVMEKADSGLAWISFSCKIVACPQESLFAHLHISFLFWKMGVGLDNHWILSVSKILF